MNTIQFLQKLLMKKITDNLFLVNAVYFIAMAIAHFFSIKLPVLFIYYNVPFYGYQDRIISFAVCSYIILFLHAYKNDSIRLSAIILLYITCVGLSIVNLSDGLKDLLIESQTTVPYWIQTIGILIMTVVLHFLHYQTYDKSGSVGADPIISAK